MTKDHEIKRKALTAATVKRIKPPAAGQKDHFDATLPSFALRVSATGARSYIYFYRPRTGPRKGKLRRLTVGRVAEMELAEARRKVRRYIEQVDAGDDPASLLARELQRKDAEAADTVQAVAEQFIKKYAKRQTKSWRQAEAVLQRHVLPTWGDRPIRSITRRDVLDLLDGLVERDMPAMANRTLAHARKLFNWAIERSILDASPMAQVKAPGGKEQPRERELSDAELRDLWPAFESLGYPFGPMFELLLVTGQRRGEVANMKWADLDLEDEVWNLPSDATKAGRQHSVPLSPLATRIIKELPSFRKGDYVFTTTFGEKPVSGYSRAKQRVERIANEARAKDDLEPLAQWQLHDLRRTCASNLERLGIPLDHIGRVLNHALIGVTARVYGKHSYMPEKRRALDAWATHLEAVLAGEPKADNVVDLRGAQ